MRASLSQWGFVGNKGMESLFNTNTLYSPLIPSNTGQNTEVKSSECGLHWFQGGTGTESGHLATHPYNHS